MRENGKIRKKEVLPYYLKEDHHRWYLLAYEKDILKTFNVECIITPQALYEKTFKRNTNINVNIFF